MEDIINKTDIVNEYGFIILRHVNSSLTNQYWIKCYNSIRNFYKEYPIVIIDDNSNYEYVTDIDLYKTIIINSEYPKHGEFLPYYYYLKNKWFENAIILHDSVFLNSVIDFNNQMSYKYIWNFEQCKQHYINDEIRLIKLFEDDTLLNFYKSKKWTGCFGGMCSINYNFLVNVNNKYNLNKLLKNMNCKENRCSFERVIACLTQHFLFKEKSIISFFGEIHRYCKWGITFSQIDECNNLPIIKVWTGR